MCGIKQSEDTPVTNSNLDLRKPESLDELKRHHAELLHISQRLQTAEGPVRIRVFAKYAGAGIKHYLKDVKDAIEMMESSFKR